MTPTPEQIAAGLSATLERELFGLSADPADRTITWLARYGYRLEGLGLAARTLLSDRSYATPLGLAVRAIIKDQPNDQ